MKLHLQKGYHPSAIGRIVTLHADFTASDGAHLRWFIASDTTRGSGIGSDLLTLAMAFCKFHSYKSVYLNTFSGLDAARHLYEKHGFKLVQEQRGVMWGGEVNEQRFECQFSANIGCSRRIYLRSSYT